MTPKFKTAESSLTYDSNYLPSGRGDACVPQAGFVRHAGQTKKAKGNLPLAFLFIRILKDFLNKILVNP
jgi:hypothetical protein